MSGVFEYSWQLLSPPQQQILARLSIFRGGWDRAAALTVAEAGLPGFQSLVWFGLLGPAGTPKAVVDRVNAELNKALLLPEIQARFVQVGFEPAGGTSADFARTMERDAAKWSKVIKDAGVKPE